MPQLTWRSVAMMSSLLPTKSAPTPDIYLPVLAPESPKG
jgi:hypothetical protein